MTINIKHQRKKQMSKMKTAEVHSFRITAGYSMMDHKHNEDIREMEITNINYTIKSCQKWLKHLERMPENQIPKLL
jgi:hypothetical protein